MFPLLNEKIHLLEFLHVEYSLCTHDMCKLNDSILICHQDVVLETEFDGEKSKYTMIQVNPSPSHTHTQT